MTRKDVLGNLMSHGVVVTNPLFETEDLEMINEVVEETLETYCDVCDEDCDCPDCCDEVTEEETEDEEDLPVEEQELIGKVEGDTEVVHVLYPGADQYPLLMDWANRMKDEYEGVDLKYFEDQDAFVFYVGDEDEALSIAESLIEDLV